MTLEPAPRRLPGDRLRGLARRICSTRTLLHVVDPIVADLQHEWIGARQRSRFVRLGVRLRGYGALGLAGAVHLVLAATRHLGENAFGRTPEDREFHRRAASATLTALALTTSLTALYSVARLAQSLVFAYTHLQWPGPPTVTDVLPAALQVATDPRGLLLLAPCLLAFTLPPSLLIGLLVGLRRSGVGRSDTIRPFLRGVGGITLAVAILHFILAGWATPALGQRYRQHVVGSAFDSGVKRSAPPRGVRELSLTELRAGAHVAASPGAAEASRIRQVEWHRRWALAVASLAFGLLALGLAAQPRDWTTRQVAAITVSATFVQYLGVPHRIAGALNVASAAPIAVEWSGDVAIALLAAVLLVRASWRARTTSAPA